MAPVRASEYSSAKSGSHLAPGAPAVISPSSFDDRGDVSEIDLLHEIGSRIAAADPLHGVLARVVEFVASVVACDSCFVYVLDGDELVLRGPRPVTYRVITVDADRLVLAR